MADWRVYVKCPLCGKTHTVPEADFEEGIAYLCKPCECAVNAEEAWIDEEAAAVESGSDYVFAATDPIDETDFCLIRSIERGLYVFGNKTFTGERYFARVFSYEDAEYHISQWFDPKLVELVYVPLSDIEYRNGQPAIKLDLAPPVCMLERVDLDWDGEPGC